MTRPGLLGDEGHRILHDREPDLFPTTVRPRFLALLWLGLAVVAATGAAVLTAVGGRLP